MKLHSMKGAVLATVLLICGCGGPPNYDDPEAYARKVSFDGQINPHDGVVHAEVLAINDVGSGTFDSHAFLATMITVETPTAKFRYRFPERFAADLGRVVDLDGDGRLEFLLAYGSASLRVVSFRDGAFVFRPVEDSLDWAPAIRVEDVDGNGLLDFVLTTDSPAQKSVRRWVSKGGFKGL